MNSTRQHPSTPGPSLRVITALLGMAGFSLGLLPTTAAAEGLIPRLQIVQPTVVGEAFVQSLARAKGVSPSSYTFPDTGVGTEKIVVFTLTNTDAYGGTLTVNGPPSTSGAPFIAAALSAACAGGVLAAGASCQVVAKFRPTAASYYYGDLNFNTTPPTGSVFLEGTGVEVIMPTLSPAVLDFGPQPVGTDSPTQRITIANSSSSVDLVVDRIAVDSPFDGIFCNPSIVPQQSSAGEKRLGPACTFGSVDLAAEHDPLNKAAKPGAPINRGLCKQTGFTLFPNEFCHVDVLFSPPALGIFSGLFTVVGGFGQLATSTLLGISGSRQAISASPDAVSFGGVNLRRSAGPIPVTIANTGFEDVTLNSLKVAPPRGTAVLSSTLKVVASASDYGLRHNCRLLAPRETCQAELTFAPSELGDRAASLLIEGTFEGSPKHVPIAGSGLPIPFPFLTYSISSISFGQVQAGAGATETFDVSNAGQLPVQFNAIYAKGDFFLTHDCPPSLAPGQSCRVSVTYRASVPGSSTGEIVIESNAMEVARSIPITGSSCRPPSLRGGRLGLASC